MKIKELTFAIFIVKVINDMPHLFMIHSTGNNFWDVPKGGAEANETAIQAALRELLEEAGIVFVSSDLKDLGVFEYNARKDMHVFKYMGDQYPDPKKCVCTSTFTCPYTNREKPEADGFKYIPFNQVSSHCAKSFKKVFEAFIKVNM